MISIDENMGQDELLSDDFMERIFSDEDDIEVAKNINAARGQAKKLGVTKAFDTLVTGYKRYIRQKEKEARDAAIEQSLNGWTDFETDEYPNMLCGSWIANVNGVRLPTDQGDAVACNHPILPIEQLQNVEDGTEKVRIAFKRKGKWREVVAPREVVASANRIVSLSNCGISVTSETARLLVRYLSNVEDYNDQDIKVTKSSSKLGWHKDGVFLPYDDEIVCDAADDFRNIYHSVHEQGEMEPWLDLVTGLRKDGSIPIRLAIGAAFASVLVEPLRALPFVIDFWSPSGGGKTVLMMLAASVWACPEESQYIGNFDQTVVGMEARADFLHSLPLMLDDTSNAPRWTRDEFERLVYMVCSGKGKTRSNKQLGQQRERRWLNCTLSNGEKPLRDYAIQGGAINRVIEVYCDGDIFKDPRGVLDVVNKNYGHVGRLFVEKVKTIDGGKLQARYKDLVRQLTEMDKTVKQSAAMALIMLADELATEIIFKDGRQISLDNVKDFLVSQEEISDDVRCYEMLCDKVNQNRFRFDKKEATEQWGLIENDEFALFYPTAIKKICADEGFSFRSFAKWAIANGKMEPGKDGRAGKQKKINGRPVRMYWVRIGDGFMHLDEDDDCGIPFLTKKAGKGSQGSQW